MNYMFGRTLAFNQDISSWEVSTVTNMSYMFFGASFFNKALAGWGGGGGKVTNMRSMFDGASSFNQNITEWDVSRVETMHMMFHSASSLNQEIGDWEVGKVQTCQTELLISKCISADYPLLPLQ